MGTLKWLPHFFSMFSSRLQKGEWNPSSRKRNRIRDLRLSASKVFGFIKYLAIGDLSSKHSAGLGRRCCEWDAHWQSPCRIRKPRTLQWYAHCASYLPVVAGAFCSLFFFLCPHLGCQMTHLDSSHLKASAFSISGHKLCMEAPTIDGAPSIHHFHVLISTLNLNQPLKSAFKDQTQIMSICPARH